MFINRKSIFFKHKCIFDYCMRQLIITLLKHLVETFQNGARIVFLSRGLYPAIEVQRASCQPRYTISTTKNTNQQTKAYYVGTKDPYFFVMRLAIKRLRVDVIELDDLYLLSSFTKVSTVFQHPFAR